MDLKLHHCAYRINLGCFNKVSKLLIQLGCTSIYTSKEKDWGIFNQNNRILQIIETPVKPLNCKQKLSSHIGFISSDPLKEIKRIEKWAKKNKLRFVHGSWSELEFWFYFPELFNDFVIEVMNKKIIE
ncbi:MAG: hypothetical protein WCV90_08895 [Candidatus Woesearchaeota archaeon]|jgi:hypothetical protein